MQQFSDEKLINLEKFLFLPKIRLECIDLEHNHYKFYEIETEPLLFFPKITRRWGRIGKDPRSITMEFQYFHELVKEFESIIRIRYNHEYILSVTSKL